MLEQRIERVEGGWHHLACCDRCSPLANITSAKRYVCMTCVDSNLREECYKALREDKKEWRCEKHGSVCITTDEPTIAKLGDDEYVKQIQAQYAEAASDD